MTDRMSAASRTVAREEQGEPGLNQRKRPLVSVTERPKHSPKTNPESFRKQILSPSENKPRNHSRKPTPRNQSDPLPKSKPIHQIQLTFHRSLPNQSRSSPRLYRKAHMKIPAVGPPSHFSELEPNSENKLREAGAAADPRLSVPRCPPPFFPILAHVTAVPPNPKTP
jgi:hypothetical protein